MLYEFVTRHREAIIARTRLRLRERPWPSSSPSELDTGVPLFLDQLEETLRLETTHEPVAGNVIGDAATGQGRRWQAQGFAIAQVVHGYGDICQAVAEVALEQHVAMSVEEFQTLNRCLDTAIAEAVTEHARATCEQRDAEEIERLGSVTHEIRNFMNSAMLAFHVLKSGTVAINGQTGAVLGQALLRLRDFVGTTLSDVRLAADRQRRERMPVQTFLNDIVGTARLHAECRGLTFTADSVSPVLLMTVDPELLASAVNNLLTNAFKYSRPGGRVALRAHQEGGHLVLAVHDQCGGIPPHAGNPFEPFGERRGNDRSGLGLGLSIARKAVRAHGGDIRIDNLPGVGCIFTIEIPLEAAVIAGG